MMSKRKLIAGEKSASILTLFCTASLALSACGLSQNEKEAVAEFSRAATVMGEAASTQVVQSRETYIELTTQYMALKPAENPDSVDGALSPENVEIRVKAARTVQAYGMLLLSLVQESQTQEIKAAGGAFTSSIRALDTDAQVLSEQQLDAIGKLIVGIGGLWVEEQKADALKKIVPEAHPQVAKIGELFDIEFSAKGGVIPSALDARARKVLVFAGKVLDEKNVAVSERRVAAQAKAFALAVQQRADHSLPSVSAAAEEMVKGHDALKKSLESGDVSLTDIKAFAKSVEDLIAAAAVFAS